MVMAEYGTTQLFLSPKHRYVKNKMQQVAAQRDEEMRHEYFTALAHIYHRRDQLLFLDETSKCESKLRRMFGWGLRGQRVQDNTVQFHDMSISVLALYNITGFVDFSWRDGSYDAQSFMDDFETMVVPNLQPYPQVPRHTCHCTSFQD